MCLDVAHRILQITEIRVIQLHASSCYRLHNVCCGVVLHEYRFAVHSEYDIISCHTFPQICELFTFTSVLWWKRAWKFTLYKLKVLFHHCILGINRNLGKFFKILMQKVYEEVKKFVA